METGIGRIYIKVGSEIIDLSGSTKEVRDDWLKIKEDESWEGMPPLSETLGTRPYKLLLKESTKWNLKGALP